MHLVVVVVVKLQFLLPPLLRTRVLLRYTLQPNSCAGDQQCRRDGRTEYIKIENNYFLYIYFWYPVFYSLAFRYVINAYGDNLSKIVIQETQASFHFAGILKFCYYLVKHF